MTITALDCLHAARHALDEGATQTARCLLDSIEKHLTAPSVTLSATAPKPRQAVSVAPPTIQPSLLAVASGVYEWTPVVINWIDRLPENRSFTHYQICKWIENESGIILNEADKKLDLSSKTPAWKLRVSQVLTNLKQNGTIRKKPGTESVARSRVYVVNRLP